MIVIDESAINETFLKALSYELVVFADSLIPSKEYVKDGKKSFQTVSSICNTKCFNVIFNAA